MNYPFPQASRYYGESHWCAAFTKHFGKLPCSDCWRAGPPVVGSDIPRGTPIATFEADGTYLQTPPGIHPDQNSGLYNGPIIGPDGNLVPNSFFIVDQWPGHFAEQRPLGPRRSGKSDNSLAYQVITVPYGTKSKLCKCGNW